MSFFDDGDDPRTVVRSPRPQPRRPPPRSRRPADDRTLLLRRGAAAAIVLVVVIGIVLAVKAVLNHQAVAGLKNYNAEVSQLVGNEQVVRNEFFHEIDNAFNSANPSEVPTTLQQYISQEQIYYRDAQGWSVPAQMVGAQRWFVGALGLRYEALTGIAAEMKEALGVGATQGHAIELIAGNMEKLLSSDVIYADRVAPLITQALEHAGISGQVTAASTFLPDIGWVGPQTVAERVLGYVPTSLGGSPISGTPGHELEGVSVLSTNGTATPLSDTGVNRFPYTTAGITFVLSVLNSGNLEEHGVQTEIRFHKEGLDTDCLKSTNLIPKTEPGVTYSSSIVFAPSLCSDLAEFFNVPLDMTAEVVPLQGETDTANNRRTFLVEFIH